MNAEAAAVFAPELETRNRRLSAMEFDLPRLPLEALSADSGSDFRFVWDPPDGVGFACTGAAATVRGSGERRFSQVREGGVKLLASLSGAVAEARLVGGLAFAASSGLAPAWQGFGDAAFVLPRWTYIDDRVRPRVLSIAAGDAADHAAEFEQMHAQWRAAAASLQPRRPRVGRLQSADRGLWRLHVEQALAAIRAGRLSKVVLADRTRAEFVAGDGAFDLLLALRRPGRRSTRFACAFGDHMFLGASPERLVRLTGLRFETEALAGSIGTGPAAAAILSGSAKDREEHQLVIDAIVAQLEGLCAQVEVAEPRVSALSHLQHLRTPIVGTLDQPCHVLELAELLHPTPAVGGVPHRAALEWIAAVEGTSRGWYAGPIGWFDRRGDGELLVGLRSALAVGRELEVFAGAGLVRGSDPEAEYEETELKKRAILSVLEVLADEPG